MPQHIQSLLGNYIEEIKNIYGVHLKKIILYGSYARGEERENSDIDIMVLLDITDLDIKNYSHQLTDVTFDYNMDNDLEIMPIVKNVDHFNKWVENYPFYANIEKEGVTLYAS